MKGWHWSAAALWGSMQLCSWGEPLSLEQAVQQAVQHHPKIVAAQRRLEGARIRARYAGAPPNPVLQLGESIGDPSEETSNFRQGFELAGQPRLRTELALQEMRVQAYELAVTRREVAVEIGRAYLEFWQAEQTLRVSERRVALFQQFEHIARRRYQTGDIAENQSARVALEARRAEADQANSQALLDKAEARLRNSLGSTGRLSLSAPTAEIPQAPLLSTVQPTLEQLQQATPALPEMKRAEAYYRVAQLQTELAGKQGAPEVGLELYRSNLFRRVPEQGIQLTFTWTPWDYGQIAAEVAGRQGEERARESEIEQVKRQMAQRLEGAYHAWKGAQRRRDLLNQQVLESLRLAQVAQRAFEAGYWTVQETLDAQRSFRDAQLEYLNAESEYALMWLELTWLTDVQGEATKLIPSDKQKSSDTTNEVHLP